MVLSRSIITIILAHIRIITTVCIVVIIVTVMMTIRGIVIQLVLPITSICDDAVGGGGDCLFSGHCCKADSEHTDPREK